MSDSVWSGATGIMSLLLNSFVVLSQIIVISLSFLLKSSQSFSAGVMMVLAWCTE